jgi:Flp pilus assembly protein TadG
VLKTNVRRNQYSVVVTADDKMIEKKDKTTNEPVQFYVVSKARQPYEIVVNEVSKNMIKGYLATPKVTTAVARNN